MWSRSGTVQARTEQEKGKFFEAGAGQDHACPTLPNQLGLCLEQRQQVDYLGQLKLKPDRGQD